MEEEFQILAAKVLAGEATTEEARRLQELLAQHGNLRADFADLRATWAALNEVGALAEALDASPATPPPERLERWQKTLAQQFGKDAGSLFIPLKGDPPPLRKTLRKVSLSPVCLALAAVCLAAAVIASIILRLHSSPAVGYLLIDQGVAEVQRNGQSWPVNYAISVSDSDEIRLPGGASALLLARNESVSLQGPLQASAASLVHRRHPGGTGAPAATAVQAVHKAIFQSSEQLSDLLLTTRRGPGIAIYSPVGFTANLTPLIVWRSQPGKTYDIAIINELESTMAPLRGTGAVSPLDFANIWPGTKLAPDGLYRLRLIEAGNPLSATELVFRTVPTADGAASSNTPASLLAAYQMLTANPPCLGDALAILLTLPAEPSHCELALRLRLWAFGQLGYHEEFSSTIAELKERK